MVDFLHDFDLGLYIFGVEVIGEDTFVDHFNCDWLTCLNDFASID